MRRLQSLSNTTENLKLRERTLENKRKLEAQYLAKPFVREMRSAASGLEGPRQAQDWDMGERPPRGSPIDPASSQGYPAGRNAGQTPWETTGFRWCPGNFGAYVTWGCGCKADWDWSDPNAAAGERRY
jgi:hypothetical protein